MDQAFIDLVGKTKSPILVVYPKDWKIVDESAGEISVVGKNRTEAYKLKPMEQLFGPGRGLQTLDTDDDYNQAILMAVEMPILHYDREEGHSRQDADVLFALKPMAMDPAASPGTDRLMLRIQLEMRVCLSLNNFSKQEVKLAVRKVQQSVQRHNRDGGIRGYLDFMHEVMPGF